MTTLIPEGHKPKHWIVVSQMPLVITTECICGEEKCYFVAAIYNAINQNLDFTGEFSLRQ